MARHQLSFSNERLFGGVFFKGFGRASAQSSPLLKMPRRQMQTFSFRAAFCVRFTPAIRFYWDVLRSVHACCLPHSAKQDGLRYVPFLFRRGSRSPFVRSRGVGAVIYLGGFTSGLFVYLWRSRQRTEGTRRTESAVWQSAFLRKHIGFVAFSAGSTLGLRAPDCAKETCLPGLSSFGS